MSAWRYLTPSPCEGDKPGHASALRAGACLASLSRMQAAKWTGWGGGAGVEVAWCLINVSTPIPTFPLPGGRS